MLSREPIMLAKATHHLEAIQRSRLSHPCNQVPEVRVPTSSRDARDVSTVRAAPRWNAQRTSTAEARYSRGRRRISISDVSPYWVRRNRHYGFRHPGLSSEFVYVDLAVLMSNHLDSILARVETTQE